jgi:preprotein translocase subunit SecA
MMNLLQRIVLGDPNARELRRHQPVLERINSLADEMRRLPDEAFPAKTAEFKERLANGESLDDLLPEAFALAREAADRAVGLRPYDVQVLGAIVLHQGKIAEMATGEGKTLVAVLPVYLNALEGKGVHVVTVNDYLARRDAEWMGSAYRFLGLEVGVIGHDLEPPQRKAAYACDVTYGTNNELGFDYLRDNLVVRPEDMVHRGFHYAIVDEVDSILIDEARTPLIISGPGLQSNELYYRFADIVRRLTPGIDYTVDEKAHTVAPTEEGIAKVEAWLGVENLYADARTDYSHYLMQALKAEALMHRDRDYVVRDGEVIIVDEFTGRLMFGRRYSDGLHQAIEAKEGVKIESESMTLATITFQNFFRLYDKLAGMTGTAATEAEEFQKIYGLDVVTIPTNKPCIREDLPDLVFKTEAGKIKAIVEDIVERHRRGQPVLVGTVSIEKSERLSRELEKRGIEHQVLNAKHHEREAEIIARAGQRGAVTIATNMAGRGTDIVLGEGVKELGGLYVLGTERHEARRIDNQLRGRSGRQGDPGQSRFYLSLEDDLLRLFGSEGLRSLFDRAGLKDDEPLEHPLLSRGIETAQRRVEGRNFDIRKHLLEYDDVINKQREIIYEERRKVLFGEDLSETLEGMMDAVIGRLVPLYCQEGVHPDEWNRQGLVDAVEQALLPPGRVKVEDLEGMNRDEIIEFLAQEARAAYHEKENELGPETMRILERLIMLRVVDEKWTAHLDAMEDLKEGIYLRGYGQVDPLVEYKREGFQMFEELVEAIQEDTVRGVMKVQVVLAEAPEWTPVPPVLEERPTPATWSNSQPVQPRGVAAPGPQPTPAFAAAPAGPLASSQPLPAEAIRKVGRNDPCPCGSGKKYKKCHGRTA